MRRWLTTFAAVLFLSAALRADVTIVQTTTVEGGMAQMAAASGANMSPKITMRVKGMKMRSEVEAGPVSVVTIVDVPGRQVIVLRADQKTATIVSSKPPAASRYDVSSAGCCASDRCAALKCAAAIAPRSLSLWLPLTGTMP